MRSTLSASRALSSATTRSRIFSGISFLVLCIFNPPWLSVTDRGRGFANPQPVGAHAVPLLYQHSMRLEQGADTLGAPAGEVLEHRHQHAQRVVADDRAPRDLRDVLGLGGGDGEAAAMVDLEHHVDIRTAVADVDHAIARYAQSQAQFVDRGHLAPARRHPHDRLDLARAGGVTEAR